MSVLLVAVIVLVLIFGFVVFFGPPYLPTKKKQIQTALDLLDLKSGETMLDLGSGDGRVMLAAAKRGWRVVGIELNPLLVLISRAVTWQYRKRVTVKWGSYFKTPWPERVNGIFVFMIPRHMPELDRRIALWRQKPLKVASFAFQVPGKKPTKTRDGILLYEYK